MPRVVRDSDEDVEAQTTVRRTRSASVASSVASVTDSPRRATRSKKQLATIESSPESVDETKPATRATRSRAATLDKGAAKNLRSRKNSNSSNLSESVEIIDLETTTRRVTRKAATAAAAAVSAPGTPTKINSRTRSLRAGSETKSTPPATRNKRVTRAGSVDPVNNLNESVGTPVKRRTRASMVPAQPTVTEEQEVNHKSSDNSTVDVDEDTEITTKPARGRSSKRTSKSVKDSEKEENDGKSVIMIEESSNDCSENCTPDPSIKMEEDTFDKSSTPDTTVEESTNKLNETEIHVDSTLESSKSIETNKSEGTESAAKLLNSREKLENSARDSGLGLDDSRKTVEIIKSSTNDENEVIDVEELTESNDSTLTDDYVIVEVVENSEIKIEVDHEKVNETDLISNKTEEVLTANIECERHVNNSTDKPVVNYKDSYVKLERTNVEKVLSKKVEEVVKEDDMMNLDFIDLTVGDSHISQTHMTVSDVNDECNQTEKIHKDNDGFVDDVVISKTFTAALTDNSFISNDILVGNSDSINVCFKKTQKSNDDQKLFIESRKEPNKKYGDDNDDGNSDIMLVDDNSVDDDNNDASKSILDNSKTYQTSTESNSINIENNIPAIEKVDVGQEISSPSDNRSFLDEINDLENLISESNSETDPLDTSANIEVDNEVELEHNDELKIKENDESNNTENDELINTENHELEHNDEVKNKENDESNNTENDELINTENHELEHNDESKSKENNESNNMENDELKNSENYELKNTENYELKNTENKFTYNSNFENSEISSISNDTVNPNNENIGNHDVAIVISDNYTINSPSNAENVEDDQTMEYCVNEIDEPMIVNEIDEPLIENVIVTSVVPNDEHLLIEESSRDSEILFPSQECVKSKDSHEQINENSFAMIEKANIDEDSNSIMNQDERVDEVIDVDTKLDISDKNVCDNENVNQDERVDEVTDVDTKLDISDKNVCDNENVVPMDQETLKSTEPLSQTNVEISFSQTENENNFINSENTNDDGPTVENGEPVIESITSIDDKESSSVEVEAMSLPKTIACCSEVENSSITNQIDTESNANEMKISSVDKNSVSSAVTDADGENASSPEIVAEYSEGENEEAASPKETSKNKKNQKKKNKAEESDLDETDADLFQDIPAEEWNQNGADQSGSHNGEESKASEESHAEAISPKESKKNRKSLEKLNKSQEEESKKSINRSPNESLSKKARKSLEKQSSHEDVENSRTETADSELQESNKAENNENDSAEEENESPNKSKSGDKLSKSRRSLENSKNESVTEKSFDNLNDSNMSKKARKSLEKSLNLNLSVSEENNNRDVSEKLSTSLNTSVKNTSLTNRSRISIIEEKTEESSDEQMEVDEADEVQEISLNKSRKSLNKSQANESVSKNLSVKIEKLAGSPSGKLLSNNKTPNDSPRKSMIGQGEHGNDSKMDKSLNGEFSAEAMNRSQKVLNASVTTESPQKKTSTSFNDSRKSKGRLSGELNESAKKSTLDNNDADDDVMEVDSSPEKNERSLNKSNKSLNRSSANKSMIKAEASPRKSLSKLVENNGSGESSESETEVQEEKSNRSANKSLNVSTKSPKDKNSSKIGILDVSKSNKSLNASSKDLDRSAKDEADSDDKNKSYKSLNTSKKSPKSRDTSIKSTSKSPKNLKNPFDSDSDGSDMENIYNANKSLQRSIERMKYTNPAKHDSSSGNTIKDIPSFIFNASDSDDTEKNDDSDEMDSDVAKEYNLAGDDVEEHSDDNVAGDDCRASEQEFSDSDDDGEDLEGFLVPDDEVEDDEDDEEEDDDDSGESNEEEDGETGEESDDAEDAPKALEESKTKKDKSLLNHSKSSAKNTSIDKKKLMFSASSDSEDDEIEVDVEPVNKSKSFKEKSVNLSKSLKDSIVKEVEERMSNSLKERKTADRSLNQSKSKDKRASIVPQMSAGSESDDEEAAPVNKSKLSFRETSISSSILLKEKALVNSKTAKDKSVNLSKSLKDKSILNDSKSAKSKNVSFAKQDSEDSSESETEEQTGIQSPSKANQLNTSQLKIKNKLASIECSTPKPGALKKKDFPKENLSISVSSRNKSVSLNDLTATKNITRMSVGEIASQSLLDRSKTHESSIKLKGNKVELVVSTPEQTDDMRKAWKLVPLNRTIAPSGDETPGTKYLKKSKLNESVPVLETMKSDLSDIADTKNTSKSKKNKKSEKSLLEDQENQSSDVSKDTSKTKKRKLLDMSNVQSIDDDSVFIASKKNKKRARIEDSIIIDDESAADVSAEGKKKTKKNKKQVEEEVVSEEKPKKKKKSPKKEESAEVEVQVEKPKKKKRRSNEENEDTSNVEVVEEPKNSKKKKSKKAAAENSDDEAPESVGFAEARRSALNELQQAADSVKAQKEARKKKQKENVEQKTTLKRLPEDVLENLEDEPQIRRPDKRQKLSRNRERKIDIAPSKSMFSPGKRLPENLQVDDGYVPLSSAGGTTDFGVVNLQKAKKAPKKNVAAMNFREKMLARNTRQPMASFLSLLKKQKAKSTFGTK